MMFLKAVQPFKSRQLMSLWPALAVTDQDLFSLLLKEGIDELVGLQPVASACYERDYRMLR